MLAHFHKLRTPLGAVQKYPTTYAQEKRFRGLGWVGVSAINLWEMWSSPEFISSQERLALDLVEPFDEWEEFALFGCHYFLLIADNIQIKAMAKSSVPQYPIPRQNHFESFTSEVIYSENPKAQGLRRFAAPMPIRVPGFSEDEIGNFAGMGANNRINSYDIYATSQTNDQPKVRHTLSVGPSSRMCHTITDLGEVGSLLVGGRTSPDDALADCWLYHKWLNIWERIEDLPRPRYRHSTLDLGHGCVLVSSGRSNSREISKEFFVWSRQLGWRTCVPGSGNQPLITYGATFCVFETSTSSTVKNGLLAGGLSADGVVDENIWVWDLRDAMSQVGKCQFEWDILVDITNRNLLSASSPSYHSMIVSHKSHRSLDLAQQPLTTMVEYTYWAES